MKTADVELSCLGLAAYGSESLPPLLLGIGDHANRWNRVHVDFEDGWDAIQGWNASFLVKYVD
jgi:hypothetical protein